MAEKTARRTKTDRAEVDGIEKKETQNMTQAVLGILPSAEELAKYEKVIPGGAERILEMAENQARYQQACVQRGYYRQLLLCWLW